MLTLVAFSVDVTTTPSLITLALSGAVEAPPEPIPGVVTWTEPGKGRKAAPKTTATLTCAEEFYPGLLRLGEQILVPAKVAVPPDDSSFYDWWLHFVPVANGGKHTPDDAAVDAGDDEVKVDDDPDAEVKHVLRFQAKQVIAQIAVIDDPAMLARYRAVEEASASPRKGVLAAIDKAYAAVRVPAVVAIVKAAKAAKAAPEPKAPKATKEPKAAKAAPEPKAPKAPKEPKAADGVAAVLAAFAGPDVARLLRSAIEAVGGRKTRLFLSDAIATIEQGLTGVAVQPRGAKRPLYHQDGRVWHATKKHHNDWGTCTYKVRSLADGGYEVVEFAGSRTDVVAGTKFKNANDLLRLLTGRDYPRVQVYRYFDGYTDPV